MAKSKKTVVIERIYQQLLKDDGSGLSRTVVTNNDVVDAINWCKNNLGSSLSSNNPANFLKDVIRGKNASAMWPDSLKDARIGARQVTGDGRVFEFWPYAEGQTQPFPDRFGFHAEVQRHSIQSVSMPMASKALGRDDETYLIQVAVKLNIVETHFALYSPINVIELNHLQIGIKLRLCEVDSLFAATYLDEIGNTNRLVITAEAKKKNQRILEEQVMQQVLAAFQETSVDLVVPIALTAVTGGIYLAEFKAVKRDELESFEELTLETERLYELLPAVKGI